MALRAAALAALLCATALPADACRIARNLEVADFRAGELVFRGAPIAWHNAERGIIRFQVIDTYRGPDAPEWTITLPRLAIARPTTPPHDSYIVAAKRSGEGWEMLQLPCKPMMMVPATPKTIGPMMEAVKP